jgi:hypothetical protein
MSETQTLEPYWFDMSGKVYATSHEKAEELLYRYTLGAYADVKIKEIYLEGEDE